MFNPLLPDLSNIKEQDLENRINDLNRKYTIAAKSGNGMLCEQISVVLMQMKEEQQQRMRDKNKRVNVKNQDKDLDDLINVT